jgi:nucleoside-diphosphate-sugar epimerase
VKVLFIGGTGNISTSVSRLCIEKGIDLYLLNRGKRKVSIDGAKVITGDIKNIDEVSKLLNGHEWDAVVNWIAFTGEDVERDFKLFEGKTKQYIFISSASAYQKPAAHPVITESTPLANPFWQYSRNKITCEEMLNNYYRSSGFPITIVRPSHTYDTIIPVVIGGGSEYNIVERIKLGKKIIIHGDGTSLWTVTHAEDFAKGFVGLIGHQQAVGHAFHITSDEILTWNQIHEAIGEAVGKEPNIVHISSDYLAQKDNELYGGLLGDKSYSVIFDNSKIKTFVPEFISTIPFKVGIKRTIDWFEADPSRMIINPKMETWLDTVISEYENNLK